MTPDTTVEKAYLSNLFMYHAITLPGLILAWVLFMVGVDLTYLLRPALSPYIDDQTQSFSDVLCLTVLIVPLFFLLRKKIRKNTEVITSSFNSLLSLRSAKSLFLSITLNGMLAWGLFVALFLAFAPHHFSTYNEYVIWENLGISPQAPELEKRFTVLINTLPEAFLYGSILGAFVWGVSMPHKGLKAVTFVLFLAALYLTN